MTKVYKVTLLIVDHDKLGAEQIAEVLENTKYPNRCIAPNVMATAEREVEWSDEHPLNKVSICEQAFKDLFGGDS